MATATELMAFGMPPSLANRVQDSDIYLPDADGSTALGSATFGYTGVFLSDATDRARVRMNGGDAQFWNESNKDVYIMAGTSTTYGVYLDYSATALVPRTTATEGLGSSSSKWKDLYLTALTDATRGAAGAAGRLIYNSDDGTLNLDDGTNWNALAGSVT